MPLQALPVERRLCGEGSTERLDGIAPQQYLIHCELGKGCTRTPVGPVPVLPPRVY